MQFDGRWTGHGWHIAGGDTGKFWFGALFAAAAGAMLWQAMRSGSFGRTFNYVDRKDNPDGFKLAVAFSWALIGIGGLLMLSGLIGLPFF